MGKYEVIIDWSQEDDAFVAEVPETRRLLRARPDTGGGVIRRARGDLPLD